MSFVAVFVKMIFLSKTNQKSGFRNKSGSQPIRSHLSSILALRAGLFPNEPSLFPIETQRLRWWKARLLLRASVVEFVGSHLSRWVISQRVRPPPTRRFITPRRCVVAQCMPLIAWWCSNAAPGHSQRCGFDPPAKSCSNISAKMKVIVFWKKQM